MKARVKATGEIVCIERNLDYRGGYMASDGRLYNACDLELIVDADPDYWTRLEHQAAIAAMQGFCANSGWDDITWKDMAEDAISAAHALIQKLKGKEK